MNRFALGMCTALVALSLVPLMGWAGQVSLAPLAFAGIGAVAYTRLGGAEGHWYAIVLAALVVMPVGTVLALTAMRLQGLYLALATMAFASMVEYVFFTQPFALGTRDIKVERLHLFGLDFSSTRSFCCCRPRCSGSPASPSSRSGAARSGDGSSHSATVKPRRRPSA
jgi:branched-chain amino acid transport system permease protein